MPALELDTLTWPEVREQIAAGRDTVVIAFGATEQHGPHLPLATDALLGDRLARLVADRLDAFLAPTVRLGVSAHHLGFPGTLSVSEETFAGIVGDLVRSLAAGGFARAVLVPTHGGNFAPLAAALERLGPVEAIDVVAFTDVTALLALAQRGAEDYGVPVGEGGLHAGEWETSMMLSAHPDLVRADRGAAGFTGPPEEAVQGLFQTGGVRALAENGVIGDPAKASAEHGDAYWALALELVLGRVQR
jgi:creatinine amidohydrolase